MMKNNTERILSKELYRVFKLNLLLFLLIQIFFIILGRYIFYTYYTNISNFIQSYIFNNIILVPTLISSLFFLLNLKGYKRYLLLIFIFIISLFLVFTLFGFHKAESPGVILYFPAASIVFIKICQDIVNNKLHRSYYCKSYAYG